MNRINERHIKLLSRLTYMLGAYLHSRDTWKFGCPKAMKLFIDLIEEMGLFPNDDPIAMTVFVTDERKIEIMVKHKIRVAARVLGTETESDRRQALNRRDS